jgi:hypothetical protein
MIPRNRKAAVSETVFDAKQLLVLRKLTRAVVDAVRDDARDYVNTITPLLRPRVALGESADVATREPLQSADNTFRELQALYESVAAAEPFNLHKDLKPPVDLAAGSIEASPMEYRHTARADGTVKVLRVTAPLKWVMSYAGVAPGRVTHVSYSPRRLREVVGGGTRPVEDLRQFILHYAVMHLAIKRQPGLARMLSAMHWRLGSEQVEEFGPLPLPCLAFAVKTVRPPDDVLINHTEIAGTDAFEEVVDVDSIAALRDPVREKLLGLARSHGVIVPGA